MFSFFLKAIIRIALFVMLIPGILLTLPSAGSSKMTISIVHAIIFYFVSMLLNKLLFSEKDKGDKGSKGSKGSKGGKGGKGGKGKK